MFKCKKYTEKKEVHKMKVLSVNIYLYIYIDKWRIKNTDHHKIED